MEFFSLNLNNLLEILAKDTAYVNFISLYKYITALLQALNQIVTNFIDIRKKLL